MFSILIVEDDLKLLQLLQLLQSFNHIWRKRVSS